MKIKNKSNQQLTFIQVIAGKDLILSEGQTSPDIVPNKRLLDMLVRNRDKVIVSTSNSTELEMILDLDDRMQEQLILE